MKGRCRRCGSSVHLPHIIITWVWVCIKNTSKGTYTVHGGACNRNEKEYKQKFLCATTSWCSCSGFDSRWWCVFFGFFLEFFIFLHGNRFNSFSVYFICVGLFLAVLFPPMSFEPLDRALPYVCPPSRSVIFIYKKFFLVTRSCWCAKSYGFNSRSVTSSSLNSWNIVCFYNPDCASSAQHLFLEDFDVLDW